MKVLVNGLGNIGTSLVNLLLHYQSDLGIDEIHACKRTITPFNRAELRLLEERGIRICSLEHPEHERLESVLARVDYVFEATSNGVGLSNKPRYEQFENILGCSAQGSEKGFGVSFMSGINEDRIRGEKFVHVVSCNSHGSASLLRTFCGNRLDDLDSADFVVVRRSEDIGNHQRLVSGNVVSRHLDPIAGTHHSIDVIDLFKTIDVSCTLTASDITTPAQLTHSVRFNIRFKKEVSDIDQLIAQNPFVATTSKFDSNVVFELGRRYGFQGRLYSHAIIVRSNLLVDSNTLKGWAFVPQEGNSLISTLQAFLLQINHPKEQELLLRLQSDLLRPEW